MITGKKSPDAAVETTEEEEDYATLIYQDSQRRKREAAEAAAAAIKKKNSCDVTRQLRQSTRTASTVSAAAPLTNSARKNVTAKRKRSSSEDEDDVVAKKASRKNVHLQLKNNITKISLPFVRPAMVDSTPPPSKCISISIMKVKEEQRQQQQQTFPFKLYEMLEYSSDSAFSSSLSWSADGSAFIIHDKHVLMNDLAPMFFKQTKFRSFVSVPRATCGVLFTLLLYLSFAKALKKSTNISLTPHSLFQTRQLRIWGFVRIDAFGGEKGGWQHEDLLFLRGRQDLLREIERIEIKSARITKARVSSSLSAKRAAKSATMKAVVVTDERSFSSSRRSVREAWSKEENM